MQTGDTCRNQTNMKQSWVPFCTSRSNTSSNSFSWTAGGKSSISAKTNTGKILCFHAHYKLMVHSAEGNRNATVMTHRGDVLCDSIHWLTFCQWHTINTSSVQHVVFSLCIELCTHKARTLVAILWLNSEWHWLCLKDRETETEGGRPVAGLRPNSVCKEILGITGGKNSDLSVKPA